MCDRKIWKTVGVEEKIQQQFGTKMKGDEENAGNL